MSTPAISLMPPRLPRGLGLAVGAGAIVAGVGVAVLASRSPLVALFGLIALGVVIASAYRPAYALLILVATGPLEGAFQTATTSTLSITKVAGLLAFGSFAAHAVATKRRIVADLSHLVVLLLLGIALLSMVHAQDSSIASSTTIRYASFLMLFAVVSQSVGDHRLQRQIAWALVLAASLAGALALDRFVAGHSTVADLKGTQADDMSFMLATTMPFAFWLLGSRKSVRPLVVVLIALIATSLVFSFARGGMVALAAGIVWQVVIERRHVRVLLVGALAAGLAAFFFVQSNSSQVSSGLKLKQDVAAQNVSTRLQAWNAAADLASRHPILGIGPGNFRDVYYSVTGRPPGSFPRLAVVHNAYLDIAAELGVIALLLFLAYLALAFSRLGECVRAAVGPPGLASVVRTSLVIACVGSLTLSEQYFPQFWLFGGLAAALWAERRLTVGVVVPAVAAVATVVTEAAVREPPYDSEVAERELEERERRVRAQFDVIRAQKNRLARRFDELAQLEARLGRERLEGVAEATAGPAGAADRRQAMLAARERGIALREAEVSRRAQELAAWAAELEQRTTELADVPQVSPAPDPLPESVASPSLAPVILPAPPHEPEPVPAPAVEPPVPRPAAEATPAEPAPIAVAVGARARWNLGQLEDVVTAVARDDQEQAEELRAYIVSLREYADAYGNLPDRFELLLADVFGPHLEPDR